MQNMIFVGGAPRSGTTVTHALLCTSKRTNMHFSEISFVKSLFDAYRVGIKNWKVHTHTFFKSPEEFKHHMRECLMHSLNHLAQQYGDPEILCVKDPLLTPLFYWVHDLFGQDVKLVTVVRHPYNVVRSRQDVFEKFGQTFSVQAAESVAQEYMKSYVHLDAPSLGNVLCIVKYEDLSDPETIKKLRDFTECQDISPENVWAEKRKTAPKAPADPWVSPKHLGPINTDDRLSPLAAEYMAVIDRICASMMNRFNYPLQSG